VRAALTRRAAFAQVCRGRKRDDARYAARATRCHEAAAAQKREGKKKKKNVG